MTDGVAAYEAYALRYGGRPGRKAHEYLRFDLFGESDEDYPMDYSFWMLRNADRTVLVDCGFDRDRALARGRKQETDPIELLARLGAHPDDIDHVVLTHTHYDHIGNVDLFPHATFSLAAAELEFATGPYLAHELIQFSIIEEEVERLQQLHRDGRLHLVDESEEVAPGIRATRVGGHTPGQMIVEATGTSGQLVFASDALHFYEEMERSRPFSIFFHLGETYDSLDLLRQLDERPGTSVIAGHDPRVTKLFREVETHCFDLNAPIAPPA